MLGAGQSRNLGHFRQPFGGGLVAKFRQQLRRRPNENNSIFLTRPRELGVFRKKSVTRMDRIDAMQFGDRHQRGNIQIPFNRRSAFRRADGIGLIRLEAVKRKTIFVGVNSDGAKTQFGCRPENADGDFAAVGDK